MKLTVLLLLVTFLQVSARGLSQQVTLNEKDATLEQVFEKIKKQTGFLFFYNLKTLRAAGKITIQVKNAQLDSVMKQCLKGQPLTWSLVENIIVIKEQNRRDNSKEAVPQDSWLPTPIDISGRIVNEKGEPVLASVQVKGTGKGTSTNEKGEFELKEVDENAILVITGVSIKSFEVPVNSRKVLLLKATVKAALEEEVVVELNTGYQKLPAERATGSFVNINQQLLNRSVSTNIMSRLEDIASGLAFNKNAIERLPNGLSASNQQNASEYTLRGRSTFFSNPNLLVVVDNFPFDGNLSYINPNDIESITVLRDAAAASIWGSLSGNGVIVITTKKGNVNQRPVLTVNSNITFTGKPDFYSYKELSAAEFVALEKDLYQKGNYNGVLSSPTALISPVVEILDNLSNYKITQEEADQMLARLEQQDYRRDLSKYIYQNQVVQQYAVNLSGGGLNNRYFISGGLDKDNTSLRKNAYQRVTARASNTITFWNEKLEFNTDMSLNHARSKVPNSGLSDYLRPYTTLVNDDGSYASGMSINAFKKRYTETAGQGMLLDWVYRPLQELDNAQETRNDVDYHVSASLKAKLFKGLDITGYYQYNNGKFDLVRLYNQETYYTRHLINNYSVIDFVYRRVTRPIPLGSILDIYKSGYNSTNLRLNIRYEKKWGTHDNNAFAGSELKKYNREDEYLKSYGYDPETGISTPVDYSGLYRTASGSNQAIPSPMNRSFYNNNYISNFLNLGYTYRNKYSFTASARRDESNLFGVDFNNKGVLLWSTGLLWKISSESFWNASWFERLQLRTTYGVQGNVNRNVAAITTATYGANNNFGQPAASISNIPNPTLRWERVNHWNIGVDFSLLQSRFSGTFELFNKNATDLIASGPMDPTLGASSYMGNTADMRTSGMDLQLNIRLVNRPFKWNLHLLFSKAKDKLTDYKIPFGSLSQYLKSGNIHPIVGNPIYGMYAIEYVGLNSSGAPIIKLDGEDSENYAGLLSSRNFNNLKLFGSINPTTFGSLRNDFTYKNLQLSVLITYKFNYYFRMRPLSYTSLYNTNSSSMYMVDYLRRWQKPGDEMHTNVPVASYPANPLHEQMYSGSDQLVRKGDHIRLKDVQLTYTLRPRLKRSTVAPEIQIYSYVNNIGILWRDNQEGIDPDAVPVAGNLTYPLPTSISIGVRVKL